jgi:hypothetical protein
VALPEPLLLLDCRPVGGRLQALAPDSSSAGSAAVKPLLWRIPAGNLDHHGLVSWGTLLSVTWFCVTLGAYAVRRCRCCSPEAVAGAAAATRPHAA